MTAVSVIGAQGKTVDLPEEIFAAKVNVPLIHQVVVAQQAAARQGTHAAKSRGQVRGGGKKPYRQKGTGRARQGSLRAPQYTGGGVVHGPVPRSYAQRTPKKMKAAALRGALSDRLSHGRVLVVSGFVDGDVPKTKDAVAVLTGARPLPADRWAARCSWSRTATTRSPGSRCGTCPGVHVLAEDQLNTYDVLASDHVVFTEQALTAFVSRADEGSGPVSRDNNPRDILLRPVVSEKSYGLLDEGKYTFVVAPDANKTQIRLAVEAVFGVKVTGVNTVNRPGKRRRTRYGWGKRPDTKRAIVTLAAGDRIDIFGA